MTTRALETREAGLRYIATQDGSVSADGLQCLARHFLALAGKDAPPRGRPLWNTTAPYYAMHVVDTATSNFLPGLRA